MIATLAAAFWLAIAVPAALALVTALGGQRLLGVTRRAVVAGPLLSAAIGVALLAEGSHAAPTLSLTWLVTDAAVMTLAIAPDAIGAIMLVVVGVVAAMVMVYSFGYMREENGLARYFAVLSLFTAAMNAVVLSTSLLSLFVAWELVGTCSYLLIGFWFARPSAAKAAMKAFLVTRVGDVGLLLALAIVWRETGSFDVSGLGAVAVGPAAVLVASGVALAAIGKSAQFPLHIWLPDAMEGPTPVSALIHAATMVAAGVFLVIRAWPVFEATEVVRGALLAIGVLTALGAAISAGAQTDIKKVLAYSTISQLGFMFAALGAASPEGALFHLVTHAAFKALLFLAAGSVIHAVVGQDIREMGGLAKSMPRTAGVWALGALALAGVPPLAGFFSKDSVLYAVFGASPLAGVALFAASLLTAAYVARVTRLVFWGPAAEGLHPHESPAVMTVPMFMLAGLAVVAGAAGGVVAHAFGAEAHLDAVVAGVSSLIAVLGLAVGWRVYAEGPQVDAVVAERLGVVHRVGVQAFGVDLFVRDRITRPSRERAIRIYHGFDKGVIDRVVEGAATVARGLGEHVRALQTGEADVYAGLVVVGAVVLVALGLWMVR